MANTRKLRNGENALGALLGSGEANRQRRAARRQIEGLSQQDQVIALLTQISDQLQWITEEMVRTRKPVQTWGTPQG